MKWNALQRAGAAAAPVPRDRAKTHLSVDYPDHDEMIDALILAAADSIEGPHGAGIALKSQQWDAFCDEFPAEVVIPIRPLISIDTVKYIDSDGVQQTWGASNYETDLVGGRLRPVAGVSWPSTKVVYNAVEVRFTAGYTDVPEDLQQAVLLTVGHWYEHREDVADGRMQEIPLGARSIVDRYRRGTFGT